MNGVVLFALFACVAAQFGGGPWMSWQSDRIHDHRFEYHKSHSLMLVLNKNTCWIIDVDHDIDYKLSHHDSKIAFEDELYALIMSHTGEVHAEGSELRNKYHDTRAFIECLRHDVYHLQYENSTTQTTPQE